MNYEYDDGGRADAGYKGKTGDCGVRAITIATRMPSYQEAYELVAKYAAEERGRRSRTGKLRTSHPRTGIYMPTMKKIMADLGWQWHPTMGIGTGATVHLRAEELPAGRIIVRLSKHYCAVINGVVHDTYDGSRNGTRCVYGYWTALTY
jgi:hypothetical protein